MSPLPSSPCRGHSLWHRLGQCPGRGTLDRTSRGAKDPVVFWGVSPAAQIQTHCPEWSWESSRTVVFHMVVVSPPKGAVSKMCGDFF